MKKRILIIACLLISCEQNLEKKQVKKEFIFEKTPELYPWNCTDSEIEYFESLVEFDTNQIVF
jgi:hypothetical protein